MTLLALFIGFVADDSGQDIIEYGLLAATIGVAGILVLPEIGDAMGAAYSAWGADSYEIWCPDDPGGAACS